MAGDMDSIHDASHAGPQVARIIVPIVLILGSASLGFWFKVLYEEEPNLTVSDEDDVLQAKQLEDVLDKKQRATAILYIQFFIVAVAAGLEGVGFSIGQVILWTFYFYAVQSLNVWCIFLWNVISTSTIFFSMYMVYFAFMKAVALAGQPAAQLAQYMLAMCAILDFGLSCFSSYRSYKLYSIVKRSILAGTLVEKDMSNSLGRRVSSAVRRASTVLTSPFTSPAASPGKMANKANDGQWDTSKITIEMDTANPLSRGGATVPVGTAINDMAGSTVDTNMGKGVVISCTYTVDYKVRSIGLLPNDKKDPRKYWGILYERTPTPKYL